MARLTIQIGASIKSLKDKLGRAKVRFKRFFGSIRKLGSGLGGVLGIAGLVAMTKKLISSTDEVAKSAKRLGVSAEFYQKLQFAAERSGASQEAALKGIKKMQATIFDAGQGLKTYIDYFEALGLTYDDLKGKSPEKQFQIIISSLNQVTDATTKSALAQKIFGRSGSDLIPMLKEYNSLAKEAVDRGVIISDKNIKNAEKFEDEITNLSSSIKSKLLNSGFVEYLIDVVKHAEKAIDKLRELGEWMGKESPRERAQREVGDFVREQKLLNLKIQNAKNPADRDQARKDFDYLSRYGIVKYNEMIDQRRSKRIKERAEESAKEKAVIDDKKKAERIALEEKQKALELEKKAKDEANKKAKEAQEKVNKELQSMQNKIQVQNLINQGKSKEAYIQQEVNKLKAMGANEEQIAQAKKLAAQQYELQNARKIAEQRGAVMQDFARQEMPIVTDALRRIGGNIGNGKAIDDTSKKTLDALVKTKDRVDEIDYKLQYMIANPTTGRAR